MKSLLNNQETADFSRARIMQSCAMLCGGLLLFGCASISANRCPTQVQNIVAGQDYSGCDFRNYNFANVDLPNTIFDNAILDNANFTGAYVPFSSFKNASLRSVNFQTANFQTSDFSLANLSRSNFTSADFRGCDFTNATLYMAKGKTTMFYGAKFNHTNWVNGKLCRYDSVGKCIFVD